MEFLGVKKTKSSRERGCSNPLKSLACFFVWNRPYLNGLNPNLGNTTYSGKFSKLGEKKNALSKIVAPGPTFSVSFEAILLNKMKVCRSVIYEKSEPCDLKNEFLGNFS